MPTGLPRTGPTVACAFGLVTGTELLREVTTAVRSKAAITLLLRRWILLGQMQRR